MQIWEGGKQQGNKLGEPMGTRPLEPRDGISSASHTGRLTGNTSDTSDANNNTSDITSSRAIMKALVGARGPPTHR